MPAKSPKIIIRPIFQNVKNFTTYSPRSNTAIPERIQQIKNSEDGFSASRPQRQGDSPLPSWSPLGTAQTSVAYQPRRHFQELEDERKGRERVVILGSGWAGYNLARALSPKKFQTIVVSPRSYFVFTPLLASTSVGTLEFRTAVEPIRRKPRTAPHYIQAWADDVDFFNKTVTLEEAVSDPRQGLALTGCRNEGKGAAEVFAESVKSRNEMRMFELQYDRLVVAVGCYSQTFNTPGVREYANFLKDVGDARRIRKTVLACYEAAALPTTPNAVRRQLLNFAIVGGGPTGFEFAAELHDLIHDDLERLYPHLKGLSSITVHDVAPKVLNMFDKRLSDYAIKHFSREGIAVKTESKVQSLAPGLPPQGDLTDADRHVWTNAQEGRPGLTLSIKGQPPQGTGMVVWSTGLMANPFIAKALRTVRAFPSKSAIFKADRADAENAQWHIATDPKTGSLITNDRLRIIMEASRPNVAPSTKPLRAFVTDVYALGDCGTIENSTYPATAQVANQKAMWLARHLNKGDAGSTRFLYRDLGVMAYLGGWKAIFQGGQGVGNISGRMAWIIWRTAYLVKSVSLRNKVLIPVYWVINWIFGRDISRF